MKQSKEDERPALASTETANKRLQDEWLDAAITNKIEWEREIERCKRQSIGPPSPCRIPATSRSTFELALSVSTGR